MTNQRTTPAPTVEEAMAELSAALKEWNDKLTRVREAAATLAAARELARLRTSE